jgi:hypothetical protein
MNPTPPGLCGGKCVQPTVQENSDTQRRMEMLNTAKDLMQKHQNKETLPAGTNVSVDNCN